MKELISRIIGGLMLAAIIFVPLILEYGVIKVAVYTAGFIFSVGWFLFAVWLSFSNHKILR